jgi:histidinol-phosphate aminotransferase
MTMAAGIGALADKEYFEENCKKIIENRAYTEKELRALGFDMTDSKTNFVFAKHGTLDGEELYLALKEKGVLVRHFSAPGISDYNRITIGSAEQMERLICIIKEILEERK